MSRYSLTLDIDDQLVGHLPSEGIVEHPSGIFLDHQQDRGCSKVERCVADFGVFLQPRYAAYLMRLNWIRLVALAMATIALAAPAGGGEATPGGKYKPAFEVGLPSTSSEIVADYIRASRSPTPDVAVKRWREFLRKWSGDASVEDMTDLTLLRQAHFELMRLYYQMGRAREADALLKKADDYAVYSVPEPAKAKQWCQTNNFCE